MQRGSFINSHAKIVGSFLYSIPVKEFLRVSSTWQMENESDSKLNIDYTTIQKLLHGNFSKSMGQARVN